MALDIEHSLEVFLTYIFIPSMQASQPIEYVGADQAASFSVKSRCMLTLIMTPHATSIDLLSNCGTEQHNVS